MDSCGIYSITNKKTGQKYIGQSIHIESFFEDGIHFGHQRVWKDDDDVWDY